MKIPARILRALAAVACGIMLMAPGARAQDIGTGDDLYRGLSNGYLYLVVGSGANVGGGIGLRTTASNAANPDQAILQFPPGLIRPTGTPLPPDTGSRLYIRVDGGTGGSGLDYIFGDQRTDSDGTDGGNGEWLQPPTIIGNRMIARWRTLPTDKETTSGGGGGGGIGGGGGGGGGTTTVTIDPRIEIEMIASFVHDTLRLQFNIINRNQGRAHSVGLAFIQNIDASPTTVGEDGPIRLPNYPYLRRETSLTGSLVPSVWETFRQLSGSTGTTPAIIHSIRGSLRPAGTQNEPTPPTRLIYARVGQLNGYNPNAVDAQGNIVLLQHDFQQIWNYQPDPSILLTSSAAPQDAGIGLYWTEQTVPAGATLPVVTLIGASTTDNDFTPPLSLSVSAPTALGFVTDRTNNVGTVAPNPFTVTAYVTNLTDLLQTGGLSIGPVNFSINLPQGLALAAGETVTKQLSNITAGGEGTVSWQVVADSTASGVLKYTVSAAANLGTGKSVQRSIEVPAPPAVQIIGTDKNPLRQYQMLSFPLLFGGTKPSTILGLSENPPNFHLVRYNPTLGHYEAANTFEPGHAYWFLSDVREDLRKTINPALYPPLDGQVQPGANTFTISYPRGWNQVGNPYVYGLRFSEIQVFDPETLQIFFLNEAADNIRRWISPAVYRWNTVTLDYDLLDSFGFIMQPFEGYWIRVLKAGLQFIYPGVDTPGGSVTRSALVGVGLGAGLGRATVNNWRLKISARSQTGNDLSNYIGVAPRAIDGMDIYKYDKPPMVDNKLNLEIVRTDGPEAGTRLAQDLRSPALNRKVWDLVVRSPRPNDEVTVFWPDIVSSVPRQYRLTLVDLDTNVRRNLRNTSSYVVNTGASATRRVQIIAEPNTTGGRVQITTFDVIPNRTRGRAETSVAINFALSQAADARVVIRDGRGRTIRNLNATTRAAEGGKAGGVVWDLRDQQGVTLPSGLYNVELTALGEDGQTTRQVRPYVLSR